ncbi:hypothetical protein NYE70_11350 [Paenibacillus sp. FSL R5-0407]|uniref:hypothetical protein n=1 Tax=Paenibacillus sp. FSL R5-0407 TaxID=2975320 RepID=UPI0030FA2E7D
MQQIKWEEGRAIYEEARSSPPGDWTHDLSTIREGPARLVTRVATPDGLEIVYFRTSDGAGAWPGANWDRFAVPRAPVEMEQMTLF